jgi:rod shape-determining protein MreD
MRLGKWLLALLTAALLACVPLARHAPSPWRPDLFMILAAFAALRAEGADALALCWMTGLAKDLLSAGPPGEYALLYLAAGAAMVRVRAWMGARAAPTAAALVWAAAAATECVAAWASARQGLWAAPGAFGGVLSASLITACAALPLFPLLDRVRLFSRRLKSSVSSL